MTTVFIFHGVGGHPRENWFPWIKEELEKLGHKVIVPQFPTPHGQTLAGWLHVLEQHKAELPGTVLVGHSLGVPFALNVIERYPVRAAFLVAGFYGKAEHQFDAGMKTFAQREFDWQKIHKHCKRFFVFHSDNDPYIKLGKAEQLAEKLGVKVILVSNAGHFNAASGYTQFPLLLQKIKEELDEHCQDNTN